ncbi:MAG: hypothetical protein Q4G07_07970 [Oscillospiraceae bacterium]|nr:hypothetical protein [Oscillospiraceae bacterium]
MKISRGLSIAGLTVSIIAVLTSVVALTLSAVGMARTSKKRRIK